VGGEEEPVPGVGDLDEDREELLEVPPFADLSDLERGSEGRVSKRETADEGPEPADGQAWPVAPDGGREVDPVVACEVGLELLEVFG